MIADASVDTEYTTSRITEEKEDRETVTLCGDGIGEYNYRMLPTKVKYQLTAKQQQYVPKSFLIKKEKEAKKEVQNQIQQKVEALNPLVGSGPTWPISASIITNPKKSEAQKTQQDKANKGTFEAEITTNKRGSLTPTKQVYKLAQPPDVVLEP